jgi:hypothetical protein
MKKKNKNKNTMKSKKSWDHSKKIGLENIQKNMMGHMFNKGRQPICRNESLKYKYTLYTVKPCLSKTQISGILG